MKTMHCSINRFWPAAAVCLAAGMASATTLIMLPNVETRGPQVLLREIVGNQEQLPDGWGNRIVLPAPDPGQAERIPISRIAYALQQYPDMSDVTLRGHYNTTVRRATASLDAALLQRAVEHYVHAGDEWAGEEVQLVFDELETLQNLPAGRLEARVERHTLHPRRDGRVTFDVSVTSDGKPVRRHTLTAKVMVMRPMWTTVRPLRRGQVISADDIEEQIRPWHPGSPGIISDEQDITGLEAGRNLQAGHPVYRHHLMEPVCARNGDLINVYARHGGLEVKLRARALSTGRRGDRIMCLNESSRRRMLVVLTGPRRGKIEVSTLSMRE